MGTRWSGELNDVSQNNNNGNNKHVIPHKSEKEAMRVLSSKLPHNCESIVKNSDHPIDKSSLDKIFQQLHAGVYLNGRKMKYWVEKKGNININCFVIFANGLFIVWGDTPIYWHLYDMQTREHGVITVAQLRNVCWVEVHGRINTANLTPGVTYQVTYLIKLEDKAYGWVVPVNLRLTLPNGTKQHRREDLRKYPKEEWIRLPVGEFEVSPDNINGGLGEVEFSLYEYEHGHWKKGLVIQGAIIEPKVKNLMIDVQEVDEEEEDDY